MTGGLDGNPLRLYCLPQLTSVLFSFIPSVVGEGRGSGEWNEGKEFSSGI